MSNLELFNYGGSAVRVIMIDGEPWFVAADVCRILGIVNNRDAVSRLDRDGVGSTDITDDLGRRQSVTVVDEPSLYLLVFNSRRPEAKAFQRWVTSVVLPSIRKTGQYAVAEQFAIPRTYAEALELAASQAREIEDQERELAAARPKVQAYDQLIDANGNFLVGVTAKMINVKGLGQNKLYALLREAGVLQSQRGSDTWNVPKQRHIDVGRFVVKARPFLLPDGTTGASHTTLVTPKGLEFIRQLVAGMGYHVPEVLNESPQLGV